MADIVVVMDHGRVQQVASRSTSTAARPTPSSPTSSASATCSRARSAAGRRAGRRPADPRRAPAGRARRRRARHALGPPRGGARPPGRRAARTGCRARSPSSATWAPASRSPCAAASSERARGDDAARAPAGRDRRSGRGRAAGRRLRGAARMTAGPARVRGPAPAAPVLLYPAADARRVLRGPVRDHAGGELLPPGRGRLLRAGIRARQLRPLPLAFFGQALAFSLWISALAALVVVAVAFPFTYFLTRLPRRAQVRSWSSSWPCCRCPR